MIELSRRELDPRHKLQVVIPPHHFAAAEISRLFGCCHVAIGRCRELDGKTWLYAAIPIPGYYRNDPIRWRCVAVGDNDELLVKHAAALFLEIRENERRNYLLREHLERAAA